MSRKSFQKDEDWQAVQEELTIRKAKRDDFVEGLLRYFSLVVPIAAGIMAVILFIHFISIDDWDSFQKVTFSALSFAGGMIFKEYKDKQGSS